MDIIRIIINDGWYLVSIKGSHHKYKHHNKPGIVVIPHPRKTIPVGTAAQILKIAGIYGDK